MENEPKSLPARLAPHLPEAWRQFLRSLAVFLGGLIITGLIQYLQNGHPIPGASEALTAAIVALLSGLRDMLAKVKP